jgi:hypothetical protein
MPPVRRLIGAAAPLACACLLLASCGGQTAGLIPTAKATPLERDFEEVARRAEQGNGSCAATEQALAATERDFAALRGINRKLSARLENGIANLHTVALARCTQRTTTTSTTRTTSRRATTSPTTQSLTTVSTSSTVTTQPSPPASTEPSQGGGTQAPGESEGEGGGEPGGAGGEGEGEGDHGGGPGGEGRGPGGR